MLARFTLLATALSLLAAPVRAQDVVIGVAAPLSEARAVLGAQVVAGVREIVAGAENARSIEADTECTTDGGVSAARRFALEGADVVVGFLCTAALEAALPILTEAGIPTIVVGVRADRITANRQRSGFKVWRLAPGSDAEADTLAAFVADRWAGEPFGIVEDGSAYARDLADEIRERLTARTIEPILVENYRPADDRQFAIARRIQDSGVSRIVLLGTRRDVAIVARDAAELGTELDIIGGESLIDEPAPDIDIPQGIRAAGIPDPTTATDDEPIREGYHQPAAAAATIALAAVEEARSTGRPIDDVLSSRMFDTALGPIAFDALGNSNWNAFGILQFDGTRFVVEPQS